LNVQPNLEDDGLLPDGQPEARIVSRKKTKGSVLVQSTRGERCIARLRDISTFGCNLLTEADWLRPGSYVSIRLGGDRSIQGIVRWAREGTHGVEFLRAISDAEAQQIAVIVN
jgi:hypothetical protein